MSTKGTIYRLLSLSNDLSAASRGPGPLARRYVRKAAWRSLASLLRSLGL